MRYQEPLSLLLITLLALIWIYGGLIRNDPLLDYDDRHILNHLHGLSDYSYYVKSGQFSNFLAYQPLRDMSLFLDLAWERLWGLHTFHLTNFLLWIGILFLWHRTLSILHRNSELITILVAVFAVHPTFVNSVAWVSARKHLLCCLLTLLATFFLVRGTGISSPGHAPLRSRIAAVASYFLSLLAHPISVAWPLWALSHPGQPARERSGRWLMIFTLFGAIAVMLVNYQYYTDIYPQHTGVPKWAVNWGEDTGVSFLAIGRYWFNLIIPLWLAPQYYPGSTQNLIGLLLFAGFLVLVLKRLPFRTAAPWLLYYSIPLLPVTLRMTNIFVSDTYLLISAFGLLNLLLLLLTPRDSSSLSLQAPQRRLRLTKAGLLCAFLVFAGLASRHARTWTSDSELWARAYATEPTPKSAELHASYLLQEGNSADAFPLVLRLRDWDPSRKSLPALYAKAIFLDSTLSLKEKIRLLEKENTDNVWSNYFLAWLFAMDRDYHQALTSLERAIANPYAAMELGSDFSVALAEIRFLCQKSGHSDCEDRVARIQRSVLPSRFDHQAYSRRLQDLLKSPD